MAIEKVEDIKIVVIDWKRREIELHSDELTLMGSLGTPVARIKFAKVSPAGLILQGITKWLFGHYMEEQSGRLS